MIRNKAILHQFILSLLIMLVCYPLFAQEVDKSAYNWYWSSLSAMTFDTPTGEPLVLGNSAMRGSGSAASCISTKKGKLLMYTNGGTVFNAQHDTMQNGILAEAHGIYPPGWQTGGQSSLIIPFPEDDQEQFYYLFYWLEGVSSSRLTDTLGYAVVDMTADGGLGEVVSKSVIIRPNCLPRLCAVRHANNTDAWLITHNTTGTAFYAYLITKTGISSAPIVSSVGYDFPNHQYTGSAGFLFSSPNGNYVGLSFHDVAKDSVNFDVHQFNKQTGTLSYYYRHIYYYGTLLSATFSPNSHLLYVPYNNNSEALFQFDFTLPPDEVASSEVLLCDKAQGGWDFNLAQGQTGPDGRLYFTNFNGQNTVSVIEYPNRKGESCKYINKKFSTVTDPLNPNATSATAINNSYAFPQFLQSYFQIPDFGWENSCLGQETRFFLQDATDIDSVRWFFNDPVQPGATSTAWEPLFTFASLGEYEVELNYYYTDETLGVLMNEEVQTVTIHPLPQDFTFGNSQIFCQGESGTLSLSGSQLAVNYTLWLNDSDSITTLAGNGNALTYGNLTQAGTYTITATNDTTSCTVEMNGNPQISFYPQPTVYNFAQTASLCQGESCTLTLSGSELGTSYHLIKNLATIQTLVGNGTALNFDNITETGNYTVEAESVNNCTAVMLGTATVTVGVSPQEFLLSGGGKICQGNTLDITLSSSETNTTYTLFKDGVATTTKLPGTGLQLIFVNISTSGTYTIEAENSSSGCKTEMDGMAVVEVAARPVANRIRFK